MQNVGLKYVRGGEVLHDVSLHVRPGSFHFLHGASGAGKTSLLRLLFLQIPPTAGRLTLFDEDVSRAVSTSSTVGTMTPSTPRSVACWICHSCASGSRIMGIAPACGQAAIIASTSLNSSVLCCISNHV